MTVGALLVVASAAALVCGGCAGHWWNEEPRATEEPRAQESTGASDDSWPASLGELRPPSDGEAPLGESVSPEVAMGRDAPGHEGPDAADALLLRVGLAHSIPEARVSCDGPFSVSLFAESVRTWNAEGGGSWEFRASGEGVEGDGASGSFPASAGIVRMRAGGLEALEFEGKRYRGEIEVFVAATGSLAVANVVDLESYLRGVVPKEIGPRPTEELEAVKAQAVAARTYAVASSGRRAEGSFDVLPTTEDQVYGGVDVENPVCDRGVLETAGVIVTRTGEPIHAYFHANCGGRTEARHEVWELPSVPYLKSVWDTPGGSTRLGSAFCFHGANFTWEESWSGSEIEEIIHTQLPATASTPVSGTVTEVRSLRVSDRTPSGRVRWLEVGTNLGSHRVFGDRVRWLLRRPDSGGILLSAWFELDVERRGGRVARVTARGRGYGHGVGMCQHGAMEMAREGYSFEDILKHYYSGIELAGNYGRPPESD